MPSTWDTQNSTTIQTNIFHSNVKDTNLFSSNPQENNYMQFDIVAVSRYTDHLSVVKIGIYMRATITHITAE